MFSRQRGPSDTSCSNCTLTDAHRTLQGWRRHFSGRSYCQMTGFCYVLFPACQDVENHWNKNFLALEGGREWFWKENWMVLAIERLAWGVCSRGPRWEGQVSAGRGAAPEQGSHPRPPCLPPFWYLPCPRPGSSRSLHGSSFGWKPHGRVSSGPGMPRYLHCLHFLQLRKKSSVCARQWAYRYLIRICLVKQGMCDLKDTVIALFSRWAGNGIYICVWKIEPSGTYRRKISHQPNSLVRSASPAVSSKSPYFRMCVSWRSGLGHPGRRLCSRYSSTVSEQESRGHCLLVLRWYWGRERIRLCAMSKWVQRQVGGRMGRAGVCWGGSSGRCPSSRTGAGTGRRARARGWGARRLWGLRSLSRQHKGPSLGPDRVPGLPSTLQVSLWIRASTCTHGHSCICVSFYPTFNF